MCFGALTTVEPCERCGRSHPAGLTELCLDRVAAEEAELLDVELAGYLASPEAGFFAWLARRAA